MGIFKKLFLNIPIILYFCLDYLIKVWYNSYVVLKTIYAGMAELVALNLSAAGGRLSEGEKVQRSKFLISGTANRIAVAWLPD